MWIHLLRHGLAIDRDDPACPTDPERFLTDKGKARLKAVAKGLASLSLHPGAFLSSPYVRARQSAEIAQRILSPKAALLHSEALVPHADPSAIVEALRARSEDHIMCVGHAPHLDLLLAWLVGSDEPFTALKKAGVATLEVARTGIARGAARVFAIYPPAVLRRLAGDRS